MAGILALSYGTRFFVLFTARFPPVASLGTKARIRVKSVRRLPLRKRQYLINLGIVKVGF